MRAVKAKSQRAPSAAARRSGLASVKNLLRQSWRQFKGYWRLISLIILVVALPLNLLQANSSISGDATVQAYLSMAAMLMNLAAIWTCLQLLAGQPVSFRRAYFDGTGRVVAFILTSAVVALCLIPALVGLLIYALGVSQSGVAVTAGEQGLIGFIGFLIALPSFWLLIRLGWSVYAVVEGNGPLTSLGLSWRLTRRRFWSLAGRGLALILVLLVGLMLPLTLINLVTGGNLWVAAGMQALATVILLSLLNLYLGQIYREMKAA